MRPRMGKRRAGKKEKEVRAGRGGKGGSKEEKWECGKISPKRNIFAITGTPLRGYCHGPATHF